MESEGRSAETRGVLKIRTNKQGGRGADRVEVVTFRSGAPLVSLSHSCPLEARTEMTGTLAIIIHTDHLDYLK